VGTVAMGISDDARTAAPRPRRRSSKHLRRTKLVAAFAVTALAGVGSFAATYRALVLVSVPSPATGSVVTTPAGSTGTVPTPASPARPAP